MKRRIKNRILSAFYFRLIICIMIVSIILPVYSLSVSAVKTQETTPSGLLCSEVEKTIRDYWKENESTAGGMAVTVFDKDGIIFSDCFGYADKEKNIQLDKDQVFDWGSITKTLIWVSAMQLKEQGKLDLNRDIRDYLPEGFLWHLSYEKPITMLHLMNHTAGFDQMIYDLETPIKEDIIPLGDFLKKYQPNQGFEPGTTVAYSNWGAALAGYIVECISGESFASYVHKHIFEPLNMQNTAIMPDLSDNPKVAENRKTLKSYTRDGEPVEDCYRYIQVYPAGMCTSDLKDITAFARALADPDTTLFQNKETYQELFTTTSYIGDSDIPSNAHGFWRFNFGENVIGHSGNTSSCTSQMQFDLKTGVGMVVLSNQIGESKFCNGMVQKIMGTAEGDRHDGVNGKVMVLPSFVNGPFKLLSLSCIIDVTEDMFAKFIFVHQTTDKVDKISSTGIDYLVLSEEQIVVMAALLVLWIGALIFAVVGLLVKLIRMIIRKIRKSDNSIAMSKWSIISNLLIIVSLVILFLGIDSLSNDVIWSIDGYRIWSIGFCILAIAIILTGLVGCIRVIKEKMSVIRRIYNCLTVLMMSVVIFNIMYWQLYTFWKL